MKYVPGWMKEVKEKYKTAVANAFVLTGNIGDYGIENMDLKKYLCEYITQDGEEEMRMEKVFFYDIESHGRRVHPAGADSKDESNIEWARFMEMIVSEKRSAFVFLYPQYLLPDDNKAYDEERQRIVSLHRTLNSSEFINSNNCVFIVTESVQDINSMFTGDNSKTAVCEIPLPDADARTQFVEFCLRREEKKNPESKEWVKRWPVTKEELVNLTAGLQLVAIEDILLSAFTKEKKKAEGKLQEPYQGLDRQMVMARKSEVIKKEYGDIIEILDTAGYDLEQYAGQEGLKAYFNEVVISSFSDAKIADIAPKGIIMMGPPGTGKTYFARCMAGSAGINFIEFKMSRILGKYVGESEKSMERALSVFRALAPVGVFIDEIDQAFPARGNGRTESSVNANLFGMILAEMSKPENRGRILWLGATNYPNRVDEAMKRAGRFDKKIPFFAPNAEERKGVFIYHLKKSGVANPEGMDLDEIVKSTEGYTQAEIEAVVVKAREIATRKKTNFSVDIIEMARNCMMSTQNNNIAEMENLALVECNDAEFIPEQMKERHKKLLHQDKEKTEISDVINRDSSGR